jgi:4-oxalocrotonate tautomerase
MAMPFVSIRILKGQSQERKDEIAKRVTQAICEVVQIPEQATWVVFEEIPSDDWFIGTTPISKMQKK